MLFAAQHICLINLAAAGIHRFDAKKLDMIAQAADFQKLLLV